MKISIGIIGMGSVGSSVAISILQNGICSKLLLADARGGKAEGEAMDMRHGSAFFPSAEIAACDISEMLDCQAIAVTAGRGGNEGESRLDLLKDNIDIVKTISSSLKGYKGILIVISNPVDVMTYYYQKFTGMPASRVIGTGTLLDSVRLREIIGKKIKIAPKSVHAQVIGEHGDSELVVWSKVSVGGMEIREWKGWRTEYEAEIGEEVRNAAYEVIKRKGTTNHAIGLVTASLLKWILRGDRRIATISSVINGAYGLKDIALSLPCLISFDGIEVVLEPALEDNEMEKLKSSAAVIRKAIDSVN